MKAILLAAGLGTRLGEQGSGIPKGMIRVGGRPILERTVAWLREFGVEEIAINLHHRPDDITGFFGDGEAQGVLIRYSFEPTLLGTAGALRPLAAWLVEDGRFLVVYADNLINCDLLALTAVHERSQAAATVALFHREDVSASGVAELDGEGRIRAFREKPKSDETDSRWVNAGLIVCEPRVLDFVPGSGPADFGRDVLPALIEAGERVAGYRMGPQESLHWIDTPEDLANVHALLGGSR